MFEEILLTVMDPLLRAKYEKFMSELIGHRKADVEALPAKEKLLALQWMRCDGQILTPALAKEIEEVLEEQGVEFLKEHKVFTPDVWTQLFDKATEVAPAFFRLMRRTTERIRMGNLRGRQDLLVDVDMANIVDGSTGLFMYIRNLDATPRTVVLRMQSPDFRPNDRRSRSTCLLAKQNPCWALQSRCPARVIRTSSGPWSACFNSAPLRGSR